MLRKSLPLVLALIIGLVAGAIAQNYGLVDQVKHVPELLAARIQAQSPPQSSPAPVDMKDTIRDLLASKDVQAMIQSFMKDPAIDLQAISQSVARYVAESPEFRQAMSEQLRQADTRKVLVEAARSPEFREALREILLSKEFQKIYRDITLEVLKTQKPQ